jgi:hypothetical protein
MHPETPSAGRPADSLEAQLRALPPPPVPDGLEARLLAAIPAPRPAPRRRWAVWVGVAGAAAACLLAVLAWLGRDGKNPGPRPEPPERALEAPTRPPDAFAWWLARRDLDEAETPPFAWPLEETPPVTVAAARAPDLLN